MEKERLREKFIDMPTPTAQHTWPLREVGMIVVVLESFEQLLDSALSNYIVRKGVSDAIR